MRAHAVLREYRRGNDDAIYALIGDKVDKVVNEMAWVLMDVLDALDPDGSAVARWRQGTRLLQSFSPPARRRRSGRWPGDGIHAGLTENAADWLYAIRTVNAQFGPWTDQLDEEHRLAQVLRTTGSDHLLDRSRLWCPRGAG